MPPLHARFRAPPPASARPENSGPTSPFHESCQQLAPECADAPYPTTRARRTTSRTGNVRGKAGKRQPKRPEAQNKLNNRLPDADFTSRAPPAGKRFAVTFAIVQELHGLTPKPPAFLIAY